MKRSILSFVLAVLLSWGCVFCMAGPATSTTIDLWNDYPDPPRGDYMFFTVVRDIAGYRDVRSLLPDPDGGYYTPEQPWNVPYARKDAYPWIAMHPSGMPQCGTVYGPEEIVLSLFLPEGVHYVSGAFEVRDWGSVKVAIWSGSIDPLFFSATLTSDGSPMSQDFYFVVEGPVGVTFAVGSNGEDYNDHAFLRGVISDEPPAPVPLPPALWLLAAGLAGVIGVRRKMKK